MWEKINRFTSSHAIVSACIAGVIFSPILIGISILTSSASTSERLIISTIAKIMVSVVVIFLMRKFGVFNIIDFKFARLGKRALFACILGTLALVGFLFVFVSFPGNQFVAPNASDFLIVTLSQLVGVGVSEEVLFRGLVLKILLKNLKLSTNKTINACIISSVIFGMVHLTNIIDIVLHAESLSAGVLLPVISQVVFTASFGFFAAALFLRSRTLWIPILVHGTGNLVVQTFASYFYGESLMRVFQAPAEISIATFLTSTLFSSVPVLVAAFVLLRRVTADIIAE